MSNFECTCGADRDDCVDCMKERIAELEAQIKSMQETESLGKFELKAKVKELEETRKEITLNHTDCSAKLHIATKHIAKLEAELERLKG